VNFSEVEMLWMQQDSCSQDLNRKYIDVISLDIYEGFDRVRPYYDWLESHPPGWQQHQAEPYWAHNNPQPQQFGLIPETHFRVLKNHVVVDGDDVIISPGGYVDDPLQMSARLPAYFGYANDKNVSCDRPLGERGVTGNFDGCRVWVVAGYTRQSPQDDEYVYVGYSHPESFFIRQVWGSWFALPILYTGATSQNRLIDAESSILKLLLLK
jgi:hypothetical protein